MVVIDVPWRRTCSTALLVGLVVLGVGLVFGAIFWYLRTLALAACTFADHFLRF